MPSKKVILAMLAVALAFGVVVSGCNRDGETRMARADGKRQPSGKKQRQTKNAGSRRDRTRGTELAQAPAVRPAEVLASTVRRPRQAGRPAASMTRSMDTRPQYQQNYQPLPVTIATSRNLARVQEPLPEPIPAALYYSQAAYQAQSYPAPAYEAYAAPVVHSAPLIVPTADPAPIAHPSPELAMARAALEPAPFAAPGYAQQPRPAGYVPPIEPQMFRAPIPELEPVRYQRVAAAPPRVAPVLISGPVVPVPTWSDAPRTGGQNARDAQPPRQEQGWVPSPATAMGGAF